jgi:HD superfamily phosphohydrolase
MTYLVYPGATHSRLAHALGAMHLMQNALDILHHKGYGVSPEDRLGALNAILMHDLGHAPFSHALEGFLIKDMAHEEISLLLMQDLNQVLDGALDAAIDIFTNQHELPFLHELVSSQLDMDRLDYLGRDSFFTGVTEGIIGVERILQMLDVHQGRLVVDRKGVYSIEKFLMARNLMYWQVYLHKTVLSAEYLMGHIIRRARECRMAGMPIKISEDLAIFLDKPADSGDFRANPELRQAYARLDDAEIMVHLKAWSRTSEPLLQHLCGQWMNRQLSRVSFSAQEPDANRVYEAGQREARRLGLDDHAIPYLAHTGIVQNAVYQADRQPIMVQDRLRNVKPLEALTDHAYCVDLLADRLQFTQYLPKC